ncbi:uncharacterized protein LOC128724585 [Anopheles nili]|uniref:uncharacterized protein LOC128724585 n=1 Tax=Anopheles nili TaxID=185578 RepID=UPI00237C332C|nr:uncharacterized protein LOC128724585 [Anopheles nili]
MVIKVYISGMSGNKEVKKRQQRVTMIMDSKHIAYTIIDITEPGQEAEKDFMQTNAQHKGCTISDPNPRHALPPQLFNDTEYCGDYDDFDLANEVDNLEVFLKLAAPEPEHKNGTADESSAPAAAAAADDVEDENKENKTEDNGAGDAAEAGEDANEAPPKVGGEVQSKEESVDEERTVKVSDVENEPVESTDASIEENDKAPAEEPEADNQSIEPADVGSVITQWKPENCDNEDEELNSEQEDHTAESVQPGDVSLRQEVVSDDKPNDTNEEDSEISKDDGEMLETDEDPENEETNTDELLLPSVTEEVKAPVASTHDSEPEHERMEVEQDQDQGAKDEDESATSEDESDVDSQPEAGSIKPRRSSTVSGDAGSSTQGADPDGEDLSGGEATMEADAGGAVDAEEQELRRASAALAGQSEDAAEQIEIDEDADDDAEDTGDVNAAEEDVASSKLIDTDDPMMAEQEQEE